jgi:hypothetical protein
MSLEFAGFLFSGVQFNGTSLLVGVGHAERYQVLRSTDLISSGLFGSVGSVEIIVTDEADGNVILFQNPLPLPDFNGTFLQLSAAEAPPGGSGTDFQNFAWSTESVLLVAGRRKGTSEMRVSFSDIFLDQWKTIIDGLLKGSRASRQGDPTLTWEMFPLNVSFTNPNGAYLKIFQPLHISLPWPFSDYAASLTYHIGLFPDNNGHLRSWGQAYHWWVDSGIKSSHIGDSLGPQVQGGLGTLVTQVNDKLSELDGLLGKVTDVYYLPGHQPTPIGTGRFIDNTANDVTIVIEH